MDANYSSSTTRDDYQDHAVRWFRVSNCVSQRIGASPAENR